MNASFDKSAKRIEQIRERTEAIKRARADGVGEVGIFWFFKGKLIRDAVPFTFGEDYGDFVNGKSDHCTFWPRVQRRLSDAANYEYDQVPRGRVVYRKRDETFLVYGSGQFVKNDRQKAMVVSEFKLPPGKTVFKADGHYSRIPGMLGEACPS